MKYPSITIVIATYNSEKTLPIILNSIKKQSYPKSQIKTLIVDGISSDNTRQIAKSFGCKIIDNPKRGFISAKHLGLLHTKSKYVMYLDSDEELVNPQSIEIKIFALQSDIRIKAVISSGYKNPENFSSINKYINQLGDPFSYFMYRETMNYKFFLKQFKENHKMILETNDFVVFDLSKINRPPLIELVVMGDIIDLEFLKKRFPQIINDSTLVSHFFYLLNSTNSLFAITKNDPVIHYSSSTIKIFLNKILWKIMNNIYYQDSLGRAGFIGRDIYQPAWFRLKKFFFIPYSFSIILPIIDSIILIHQTGYWIFLIHPLLSIYTACLIIYHYILNLFGIKAERQIYGS